ncbi:MAG: hypothetical protein LYZ69_00905 [Nitrososphaerales archaeon]|nr:hypothetical protein [Nitrososphaerales archaeon]
MGLRKTKGHQPYYLTSRDSTIKALRMFDWFVRRSWRSKELAVLWALIHEMGRQAESSPAVVSLEAVTGLTGYEPKLCAEIIARLLERSNHQVARADTRASYEADRARAYKVLERFLEEAPTWTEEHMMHALCSEAGASATELYNQVLLHDLTVGAVYKTVERLKRTGYIHITKHFRVNEKGPMRELLSSDCSNCFYGYSNAESCLKDAFRQLEYILERYYQKDLTEEERANSYNALKSMPLGPRVIRKVIETLSLMQRAESLMKERQVISVLKKFEEWYGVKLPIQPETAYPQSNIGT